MQLIRNLAVCALCLWAHAQAIECSSESSDVCQDSTAMLQSKVGVDGQNEKPIFDSIDRDDNDKLDRSEFQRALNSDQIEMTGIMTLFSRVDANVDGNIDAQEFQKGLRAGKISVGKSTQPSTPTSAPGGPTLAPWKPPPKVPHPTLPPTPAPGAPTPAPWKPKPKGLPDRVPRNGVVVGQPYVCGSYMKPGSSFADRSCYCNGDVYYGRKYKTGSAGEEMTFQEMTTVDGGWKLWKSVGSQSKGSIKIPMDKLRESSFYPGWKSIVCGSCRGQIGSLYGGKYGDLKQCWCMPQHQATTTTTTTLTPRTTVPPPSGDDNRWGFGNGLGL